jgi:hypothetical protein
MASTGAAVAPGPPISSVKVSSDRSYAFLELRSIEEASNAMAFDGILFNDVNLKVWSLLGFKTLGVDSQQGLTELCLVVVEFVRSWMRSWRCAALR